MSRSKKVYRIAKPREAAVVNPETGYGFIVPDPSVPYAEDHPLVRAYPELFVSDEDRMDVEDASAEPGHARWVRR